MFRLWAKEFKDNRMLRDTVIEVDNDDTRTHKIFHAIDEVCHEFDLSNPIWLDSNIDEFKRHANPPMLKKGDILLNGHTHIPANQDMADFIYMNPGSVSIPKENSAHGYMIYDQEFIWKDLDGNVIDMM